MTVSKLASSIGSIGRVDVEVEVGVWSVWLAFQFGPVRVATAFDAAVDVRDPCGWRDRERAASWSNFQHLAHQGAADVRPQPDISGDHRFAFLRNLRVWHLDK